MKHKPYKPFRKCFSKKYKQKSGKPKKIKKNGIIHRKTKKICYRRIQKGGLKDTNGASLLGTPNTWSIIPSQLESFQEYIFGSMDYAKLWTTMLELCHDKGIPVYIITSGNLIGIVRILQLLGLTDYVSEVLSTRADTPMNPQNVPINPVIDPSRHFANRTKAEVIQRIMSEEGIRCDRQAEAEYVAAFFDDTDKNFDGLQQLCPSVFPVHALNRNRPEDSILKHLSENVFYNKLKDALHSAHPRPESQEYNYTPLSTLMCALHGISRKPMRGATDTQLKMIKNFENMKILFLDWDRTVSLWPGTIPFQLPKYLTILQEYIEVTETDTDT
jgi:hypothetical protein